VPNTNFVNPGGCIHSCDGLSLAVRGCRTRPAVAPSKARQVWSTLPRDLHGRSGEHRAAAAASSYPVRPPTTDRRTCEGALGHRDSSAYRMRIASRGPRERHDGAKLCRGVFSSLNLFNSAPQRRLLCPRTLLSIFRSLTELISEISEGYSIVDAFGTIPDMNRFQLTIRKISVNFQVVPAP
jgi:hypothetical protein